MASTIALHQVLGCTKCTRRGGGEELALRYSVSGETEMTE
jgi:hypothetical protein